MEKLSSTLPDLLKEESKSSNQPIPKSLRAAILDFKNAYTLRHGRLIDGGIKSIVILMLAYGKKGLLEEAKAMKEEAAIKVF